MEARPRRTCWTQRIAAPGMTQAALAWTAGAFERIAAKLGADENLEGSWYGNDTIWRTCLDLQRIVRYGKLDGSLAIVPQRTTIRSLMR